MHNKYYQGIFRGREFGQQLWEVSMLNKMWTSQVFDKFSPKLRRKEIKYSATFLKYFPWLFRRNVSCHSRWFRRLWVFQPTRRLKRCRIAQNRMGQSETDVFLLDILWLTVLYFSFSSQSSSVNSFGKMRFSNFPGLNLRKNQFWSCRTFVHNSGSLSNSRFSNSAENVNKVFNVEKKSTVNCAIIKN